MREIGREGGEERARAREREKEREGGRGRWWERESALASERERERDRGARRLQGLKGHGLRPALGCGGADRMLTAGEGGRPDLGYAQGE